MWWQEDRKFKAILPLYQDPAHQEDLAIAVAVEGGVPGVEGGGLVFWSIFQHVEP